MSPVQHATFTLDDLARQTEVRVVWEGGEGVHRLGDADSADARFERCAPEVDSLRRRLAVLHPRWPAAPATSA